MSAPVPSPLDCVGHRRFAFHPPIAHPDPNDWRVARSSKSAVQVVNAQTGSELWVSRQYVRAVSETDSAVIVGLTKALDARTGTIEPRLKRVIEMPTLVTGTICRVGQNTPERSLPASVVQIRLESRADSVFTKAVALLCTVAIVFALLSALLTSGIAF